MKNHRVKTVRQKLHSRFTYLGPILQGATRKGGAREKTCPHPEGGGGFNKDGKEHKINIF